MSEQDTTTGRVEWITMLLILLCYGSWVGALFWLPLGLGVLATGILIALHGSLTHEALHGHPFPSRIANELMMALPLNLSIPYYRFRDLHLAHHRDSNLTDPYDDPESNYLDPIVWNRMPCWKQLACRINNTLLGRIVIGPLIGQARFMRDEFMGARRGDRAIWLAWALHLPGAAIVLLIVAVSPMPMWAYLIAAYLGLGLLKIRTFLEHRAHAQVRSRTVVIEDRGPLAFLFLNNSLHVVHHMNPKAPWYRLPALYYQNRERYLAINNGYVYKSYGEVFRRYLWRAKDPVAHPLWPND
ncbi:fatty acid desaturase [Sedimentitalea todarodis]|uniref:Fatty acid desaturase n=1 Tax=Sedimentitalea todarodis TaxID=1631240 RepID=A0ABU3VLT7_9RHOB|nr:fatty acid desaturase [Sedimentitalea todarodis]MDU9007151.1 fatty acid desaturase [Sedimentitalea todarodis]